MSKEKTKYMCWTTDDCELSFSGVFHEAESPAEAAHSFAVTNMRVGSSMRTGSHNSYKTLAFREEFTNKVFVSDGERVLIFRLRFGITICLDEETSA